MAILFSSQKVTPAQLNENFADMFSFIASSVYDGDITPRNSVVESGLTAAEVSSPSKYQYSNDGVMNKFAFGDIYDNCDDSSVGDWADSGTGSTSEDTDKLQYSTGSTASTVSGHVQTTAIGSTTDTVICGTLSKKRTYTGGGSSGSTNHRIQLTDGTNTVNMKVYSVGATGSFENKLFFYVRIDAANDLAYFSEAGGAEEAGVNISALTSYQLRLQCDTTVSSNTATAFWWVHWLMATTASSTAQVTEDTTNFTDQSSISSVFLYEEFPASTINGVDVSLDGGSNFAAVESKEITSIINTGSDLRVRYNIPIEPDSAPVLLSATQFKCALLGMI